MCLNIENPPFIVCKLFPSYFSRTDKEKVEILQKFKKAKEIKSYFKDFYFEIKKEINTKIFVVIKKSNVKKTKYSQDFKKKSKILLKIARGSTGCTQCGTKKLLQVHHIDKDKNNNDLSNLKVLCYFCHSLEHEHMRKLNPPKWLK